MDFNYVQLAILPFLFIFVSDCTCSLNSAITVKLGL